MRNNLPNVPMATTGTDPDDAPELTDAFFEAADEYVGDKLVNRGRPRASSPKLALTVRYDADVIEALPDDPQYPRSLLY